MLLYQKGIVNMNIANIVKAINDQNQYRFIAKVIDETSFQVQGHSLGFQGDELYNKFSCVVASKGNQFTIDYDSTLFEKDLMNKTVYSSYYGSEQIKRQFNIDNIDQLLQWFTNKNLDKIAFKNHDWTIELV